MEVNSGSVMLFPIRFPCHPCVLFWQPFPKWTLHGSCLSIVYRCNRSICIGFQFSINIIGMISPFKISIALNRLKSIQRDIPYLLLSWSCLFCSFLSAMDRHIPFCLALALIQHALQMWYWELRWIMYR